MRSHISFWEKRENPLLCVPETHKKTDSEYVRNGTCSIFAWIEPLTGKHHVSVREHHTATDWAEEIKYLVDVMYPDAEKIVLVMDNLNTHKHASLEISPGCYMMTVDDKGHGKIWKFCAL